MLVANSDTNYLSSLSEKLRSSYRYDEPFIIENNYIFNINSDELLRTVSVILKIEKFPNRVEIFDFMIKKDSLEIRFGSNLREFNLSDMRLTSNNIKEYIHFIRYLASLCKVLVDKSEDSKAKSFYSLGISELYDNIINDTLIERGSEYGNFYDIVSNIEKLSHSIEFIKYKHSNIISDSVKKVLSFFISLKIARLSFKIETLLENNNIINISSSKRIKTETEYLDIFNLILKCLSVQRNDSLIDLKGYLNLIYNDYGLLVNFKNLKHSDNYLISINNVIKDYSEYLVNKGKPNLSAYL